MKHVLTQKLYSYWSDLRGDRPAPERREIEPSDIREILGDTFILEATNRETYPFRLAGTRLCAAYCRELKGRNFLNLWNGNDHEAVATLLTAISEDAAAAVVGFEGITERDQRLGCELLLLPLRQHGEGFTRILGACVPMAAPYWIGIHPIIRQEITALRLLWPDERPYFMQEKGFSRATPPEIEPAVLALDPHGMSSQRRYRHLTVYDGGRN